jgi:hypothetical protein
MKYRNRFDRTGECSEKGHDAESLFTSIAEKQGWKAVQADRKQQLSHIDVFLSKEGYPIYSIDIKARKKIKRSDSETSDDLIWVEFLNVAGNAGWLIGAAEFIAFERENDFIMVNRSALWKLCLKLVDQDSRVDASKNALYKIYQRKGRKDEISIIKFSDIFDNLKFKVWPKC